MQRKRKFRKSVVQTGKLLQRLPVKAVAIFISAFTVALLAWILSTAKLNIFSSIILTFLFILGTGVIVLVVQVLALGVGKFLVWFYSRRVKLKISKISFSYHARYPNNNKREYYLEAQNNEKWYTAKDFYLYWGEEPTSSLNVHHDVFRKYKEWNKFTKWENNGFLEWVNEREFTTEIGKGRSKRAFLLELDSERNEFCIQAINREPICFPPGNYGFKLNAQAKIPKRYSTFVVHINLEYRGGSDFEIKSICRGD